MGFAKPKLRPQTFHAPQTVNIGSKAVPALLVRPAVVSPPSPLSSTEGADERAWTVGRLYDCFPSRAASGLLSGVGHSRIPSCLTSSFSTQISVRGDKCMKLLASLLILCGLLTSLTAQVNVARQSEQHTPTPSKHSEIKLAPGLFDRFVGQYVSDADPYSILSFWREGDSFFVQRTDGAKIELFAESETVFFTKVVDARVTFKIGAQGKTDGLSLRQPNGDTSYLRKISDRPVIESPQAFEKQEAMIPMRDGVRLH